MGSAVAASPVSLSTLKHLYSVAAVRDAARRVLPRPVFDFADGGAEDERTLRRNEQAFNEVALLPRPLNGAAIRDLSLSLFGAKLAMPVGIAPTGLGRPVLARRRMCGGASGGSRRYLLLRQPWLGLHAGGHCGHRDQPTLDAGVRLYRSRLHARNGGARPGSLHTTHWCLPSTTRCSATASATSATVLPSRRALAWPGRSRPPPRRRGCCACAPGLPKLTFGNYVRPGETAAIGAAGEPHGRAARPRALLGRCRLVAKHLVRTVAAEGHPAPRRGGRGRGAGNRWHHRVQSRWTPTRRRRRVAGRAAGSRRGSRLAAYRC